MRFPQAEVQQLLTQQFEQIEVIWDQNPYDEVTTYALTIKEFMGDHRIQTIAEGIERFIAFKQQQARSLAKVGLGGSTTEVSPRLPSSPRLTPQAA